MEPPLPSSLLLLILCSILTIFAYLVESQLQDVIHSPPPPITPPPPLSPPPPPPSPPPPSPPPPPPPSPLSPPPPSSPPRGPPPPGYNWHNKDSNRNRDKIRKRRPLPPPPPPPHRINTGKKIGLLFAGIAAILQIGVVGFLVFKRRQLLKIKDRYENCSST